LAGLISAIRDVPESFSHTSSPTDLARISLWISTASAALSVPGGVADAHGDVLPSALAGGKTASKYITKVIQGLRSNVTDDAMTRAIDTLGLLIKVWQRTKYSESLSIVRKCKIAWSSVLFKGAPTTIIKGKKGKPDQTVVKSPAKPSRSPWLSMAERSELGNLFKGDWSALDSVRDSWVALSAEQQHRQYNSFVRVIKSHFQNLTNISNSVHAKLGKRKHWIELVCKEDKYQPKTKRNESESFLLSAHFFNKDLSKLDNRVKKIFAPVTYFPDPEGKQTEIWGETVSVDDDEDVSRITSAAYSLESDGPTFKLWQIWADMFLPVFQKKESQVQEAPVTDDRNLFSKLLGIAQA
jgi:hypothetical protein